MNKIRCDVLVIGGGAAGCRAALSAKETEPSLSVIMAFSGKLGVGGSTNMVASEALGINAPLNTMGDGDSPEIYFEDMLRTGGGLSDPGLCRIIADESAERIRDLISYGIEFGKDSSGRLKQVKLSGCTKARSLICGGSTGKEMVRVLWKRAASKDVELLEETTLSELLYNADHAVCGARGRHKGEKIEIIAGAVVLATGGSGSLFRKNVTPSTQNGDGWAMAYEAGCRFVNMEFFQIGPAIATSSGMKFIIHSHMWSLLPVLTNSEGKEFLENYCGSGVTSKEALELKAMSYPFSVRTNAKYVDISIFKEILAGRGTPNGGVWFDVTHVGEKGLRETQPITYETFLRSGIDLAQSKIELTMAVQNFNGGIYIDGNGFTGVRGLYAAGEVTGGVHGSDRPGGNNLADTQVFGHRAGKAAAEYASGIETSLTSVNGPVEDELLEEDRSMIHDMAGRFYENLTVIRNQEGLKSTLAYLSEMLEKNPSRSVKNRLLTGELIARAALERRESRGTHYREDYPSEDPSWEHRIVLGKGQDGHLVIRERR